MNDSTVLSSPELLVAADSVLVIVDVQDKLIPIIAGHERIVWNLSRLMQSARLFGVPTVLTEQYPERLGPTIEALRLLASASDGTESTGDAPSPKSPGSPEDAKGLATTCLAKRTFSVAGSPEFVEGLHALDRGRVILAGIETAVCVLQSALDLLSLGYDVTVVVDAVGSRADADHTVAIRRLELAGVRIVTTEMVLFEWCRDSRHPHFKALSRLVREIPADRA